MTCQCMGMPGHSKAEEGSFSDKVKKSQGHQSGIVVSVLDWRDLGSILLSSLSQLFALSPEPD